MKKDKPSMRSKPTMNANLSMGELFIKKKIQEKRSVAVRRLRQEENPDVICTSMGKSRRLLYKRVAPQTPDDPARCESWLRQPFSNPHRTPAEIEEIVEMVRLSLYNQGLFYGTQAVQLELENMEVRPLPSLRTISRILYRRDLTHCHTGRYEPDGKA